MNATRNETKRVTAEVERLTIPTYPEAPAETLPMFAENRVHQRTSGNPYPNAVVIRTRSDEIEQREYTAIRLENEYIRLCILPELGGRIFTATDKSTGYDFFYRQHVIKPALIGALGSWISGGVEFNWPYHHRPSTFLPVDWSIEEEPDGSVTVWLSEHEPFDRMKGMVGVRLEPGRASFETRMKLFNRTPLRRSFLWWENAAVPVNEDYRIFFPPDVDHVYFHYRRDATSYPIAKGVFNGFDFGGEGVDISRHGSSLKSTSYFSAESKFDFFGGYDERAGRGVVHYADHHTSTGKKMFTWAYNQLSVSWERALTDTDGPYAELMAGSYTDNQPDFAWLEPYETKCFSQFWYPIADLGVPTYANGDAAVRMDGSRLYVQAIRAVDALVTVVSGDDTARIRRRLEPGRAVCLDLGFEAAEGYTVNIYEEAEGCKKTALLLRHTDEKYPEGERRTIGDLPLPGDFREGTAHGYASPSAYRCYNAGIHVMQYRDPQYDPEPYFLRALGLDPDFAPAHTALGECLLRRGEYREAAKHLRKAIGLSGTLNRNPEDGRAWYLLGLALERNSPDDAYDAFHKAMWNEGCVSCAMTGAAAIAGRRSEWKTMRGHALHALSCSAHNSTAAVYAAIAALRLGDRGTAVSELRAVLAFDPLCHLARCGLLLTGERNFDEFAGALHSDPHQTAADLYCDLVRAGLDAEGRALLDAVNERFGKTAMTSCLLGRSPSGLPVGRTFPHREEERIALLAALERDRDDEAAKYLLGCLFYSRRRYNEAASLWADCESWEALRCSAVYRYRIGGYAGAVGMLRKALGMNPGNEQLIFELAYVLNRTGAAPDDVVSEILANVPDIKTARDDIVMELVGAYNRSGRFEEALNALDRRFIPCEGGEGAVSSRYMAARHGIGMRLYEADDYKGALEQFRAAQALPQNLGAGLWHEAPLAPQRYMEGCCLEALGRRGEAVPLWEWILTLTVDYFSNMHLPELPVWQAKARLKLGHDRNELLGELAKRVTAWESELDRSDPGHFSRTPFFISYIDNPASARKAYYTRLIGMANEFMESAEK